MQKKVMAAKKKIKKRSVKKGVSKKKTSSSTLKASLKAKKKVTKKTAKKTVKNPPRKSSSAKIKKTIKKTVGKKAKKDKNDELRKLLLGRRRKILDEARAEISKFLKGDTKQLVDTAIDDGDWSFIDMAKGIDLKKLSNQKDTLNKIDEALRKIDEGTYGLCEDCEIEISEERLKIIPFALLCVECKEQREKFEEFESSGAPWLSIKDLL
jgi:DnaK suppressor protein